MSPFLEEVPDSRQRPPDTRVVRDLAIFDGHVEIHTHQHPFVPHVDVFDASFVHEPPFGRLSISAQSAFECQALAD
jgi:hypothetical protein